VKWCKNSVQNQHSPTNIHPGARTPSPRLLTNHDAMETFDSNLCNKVRKSAGNTPVSEVEALHNDLTSPLGQSKPSEIWVKWCKNSVQVCFFN
jgi:hypothetical protein